MSNTFPGQAFITLSQKHNWLTCLAQTFIWHWGFMCRLICNSMKIEQIRQVFIEQISFPSTDTPKNNSKFSHFYPPWIYQPLCDLIAKFIERKLSTRIPGKFNITNWSLFLSLESYCTNFRTHKIFHGFYYTLEIAAWEKFTYVCEIRNSPNTSPIPWQLH